MNESKSVAGLAALAVIGILAFIVINWWPLFAGEAAEPQPYTVSPGLTKEQAAFSAQRFVADRYGDTNLETFVTYHSDERFSGYLQSYDLYATYISRFEETVPIDYFKVELTRQGSPLYWVDVNMFSGAIFAWKANDGRTVMVPEREDAEQPKSDRETVYEAAAAMGFSSQNFQLSVDDEETGRFILEHSDIRIGDSRLQLVIQTEDGEVVSFRPRFSLPDSYILWADKQDLAAWIMSMISLFISFALAVTATVIAIRYKEYITFSRGIGLSVIFGVAYCINNVNMYPGFKAMASGGGMEAGSQYGALITVIFMNLVVFLMAASLYISFAAGDAMWRRSGVKLWPRWHEPSFGSHIMSAMGKGYLISLVILGTQAILFLIAEKGFDVWSTNDPGSSPYNMYWPFLFPLLAWAAAISEEGIYRFFGIILFKKLVRNTFLAVLIPSMIWALGHTAYPIYPVYTRFFEVTILGILFGYALLKYGLFTAIFAHAAMDNILMSFSLISLGGVVNGLAGLVHILSPCLVAIILYFLHQRFPKRQPPPRPEAL